MEKVQKLDMIMSGVLCHITLSKTQRSDRVSPDSPTHATCSPRCLPNVEIKKVVLLSNPPRTSHTNSPLHHLNIQENKKLQNSPIFFFGTVCCGYVGDVE